jgi:nucleotidyltransferase/DNA polymerase involved in DNA repair
MERIVFLLDMDAFFASVEERENPALKGKPVIVVGSLSPRSVVSAANYEVRKYGVHSAMGYTQAMRLCPHAEVVTVRHGLYHEISQRVFKICETFTDMIEISSIDECYMDLTAVEARHGGAMEAGQRMKREIFRTEQLTCTIGIGPNKLLAKLASEMQKPDGLCRITQADLPVLLATLPISSLHGIGAKTADKLKSMGITTAAALGTADRPTLRRVFGTYGDRLSDMGRGFDDSPIIPYYNQEPPKSVSHEHTLDADTRDVELLRRTLHYLAERVAYRLRKAGLSARNVGITVRFNNMQRITRSRTIPDSTDDGLTIYREVLPLLDAAMRDPRPVRLIGISTGSLLNGVIQQSLFDDPRRRQLTAVVDRLNEKYGKMRVKPASLLGEPED